MNAERSIDILGGLLTAAVLLLIGYNAISDPLAQDRSWLETRRKEESLSGGEEPRFDKDFLTWQKSIADHSELWRAISAPPVAPPPPPPPPCKEPTESELVAKVKEAGIRFTRSQIGKKIKIVIGEDKKGQFLAEGEPVKDFVLKSFNRTGVVLTMIFVCPDKERRTVTFSFPRE